MSFIRWDNSLCIGVEEIDHQHKGLFDIINDLVDSIEKKKGNDALGDLIARLFDYTLFHFSTEERIFSLINFPDAQNHKLEHAEFTKKVSQFKDDFLNDRFELNIEMVNFLCEWLKKHIKIKDMKMGNYIIKNKSSC